MIRKEEIQTATNQKKINTNANQNFNFLVSAGKLKQLINSNLFDQVNLDKSDLSKITSSVDDLLRLRNGSFWKIDNNFPEISLIEQNKIAFSINIETTSSQLKQTKTILGEYSQKISLTPNKNLFKFKPGNPLLASDTYNPEYWKSFISNKKEPQNIPSLKIDVNTSSVATTPPIPTFSDPLAIAAVNLLKNNSLISPSVNLAQQLGGVRRATPTLQNAGNITTAELRPQPTLTVTPVVLPAPDNVQNFSVIPTIDETKIYNDFIFELNIPFNKKELEKLNAPLGSMVVDIKPNYNFFVEQYESVIGNGKTKEQILPNMYVFCSELRNENTDEKNTIFKQHITLAGNIPDEFLDITNNKGEKIGEKDKGEYFDKFSNALLDLLRLDPYAESFLRNKFSNLIAPLSNMDLFKEFNEKRKLFPMFFDINFSTDNSTQFAQILDDSQLSAVLMKDIIDGDFLPELTSFQETNVESTEQNNLINRTTRTNKKALRVWDLSKWIEAISSNPIGSFNVLPEGVFLGPENNEIKLATNPQYDLYKNLLIVIFLGKLKTLINTNLRTFEEIIAGKMSYSENVFYRIEKSESSTGNIIQNFYLPNSNQVDVLRFIDTQVKYNKQYTYKIFVYQMVLGNKYRYNLQTLVEDKANVEVINEPLLKMVEVLYYEFNGRIMDNPPISPDVDIIPYKGINNQILFNINSGIGRYFLNPVIIEPGDSIIISQLREAQMIGEKDFLEFENDDHAAAFEIFRTDKKPFSYSDFSGKRIALVPTDISAISLQSATAASFIDNILPNKKYYYIFRSIDNHGHISNPTVIYELELVDSGGSIYPIINVVNFEKNVSNSANTKTMKRFIQFVPSFNQKIINEEKSGLIVNDEKIESVLDKENIYLGIEDDTVWGKQFKIRLTSKNTGKKIDLNINFDHVHYKKN